MGQKFVSVYDKSVPSKVSYGSKGNFYGVYQNIFFIVVLVEE